MTMKPLDRREILSKEQYASIRPDFRRRIMVMKDARRVLVGDHCSVHFENRDTMHYQIQEMLRAENSWDRPGAVDDELEAYNPIIPGAGELSATLMLEYETPQERAEWLPRFVGIDRHVFLQIGDTEPVPAEFDRGQIDEHKVSSVQYVRWRLDGTRRDLLKREGTVLRLSITHPFLKAQAVLSEQTRRAIENDPD